MNNHLVHGSYRVSIVERVLCLSVVGASNREGMLAYLEEFKKLSALLAKDGRPWASFVDLSKWELLTPDSLRPFNESAKWASVNNRTHMAIVSDESSLMDWLMDKLLEDTLIESRFFQTRLDAWTWLQALGFCEKVPLLVHK